MVLFYVVPEEALGSGTCVLEGHVVFTEFRSFEFFFLRGVIREDRGKAY